MSEPLGTMNAEEFYQTHRQDSTYATEDGGFVYLDIPELMEAYYQHRISPTPATDKLNQDIRDVTSGKKEIVIKHPDSGGATCVCGHGQTEHSWVSANTLNPQEFTRDGYCLAKPCLCGTFTPAPQEPQDGRRL